MIDASHCHAISMVVRWWWYFSSFCCQILTPSGSDHKVRLMLYSTPLSNCHRNGHETFCEYILTRVHMACVVCGIHSCKELCGMSFGCFLIDSICDLSFKNPFNK